MTRITPQKQWRILQAFEESITADPPDIHNGPQWMLRLRRCAKDIKVSVIKLLSFLAYFKYPFVRHNYEYLRYSFIFESPAQQWIDSLSRTASDTITASTKLRNTKRTKMRNTEGAVVAVHLGEAHKNAVDGVDGMLRSRWTQQEDQLLYRCFVEWKQTLPTSSIVDHGKFLKYAHEALASKLMRSNHQITSRWKKMRSEMQLDSAHAHYFANRVDEVEELCMGCTLYTSLLTIYRMSFVSGHSETNVNQHFANLFQALISDSFSEVEAQNMRQAMFNMSYFIVRERNEYSRLPRYDLPAAFYSFLQDPPVTLQDAVRRSSADITESLRKSEKHAADSTVFSLSRIRVKECRNAMQFGQMLNGLTADLLGGWRTGSAHGVVPVLFVDEDEETRQSPDHEMDSVVFTEQRDRRDGVKAGKESSSNSRYRPLPKTDLFAMMEWDAIDMVNDCLTVILEAERAQSGFAKEDEKVVIGDDVAAIAVMERRRSQKEQNSGTECVDEKLCQILLKLLDESYSHQNGKMVIGVALHSDLFANPVVTGHLRQNMDDGVHLTTVQIKNMVLEHLRYLWNRSEVLCVDEFSGLKLVSTSLLSTNPNLSYFCIFPYDHDPTPWLEDKKNKVPDDGNKRRRHGITFIRSFEECYVCAPWIRMTVDRKPCVDEVFVCQIRRALLSILSYSTAMTWDSLYHRCVLKYLLSPLQLLKICHVLKWQGSLHIKLCTRMAHYGYQGSFSKHTVRLCVSS